MAANIFRRCPRDAKFLEVIVRQEAEYGDINFILGRALSVLPEVELLKPVRYPLHRRPRGLAATELPAPQPLPGAPGATRNHTTTAGRFSGL